MTAESKCYHPVDCIAKIPPPTPKKGTNISSTVFCSFIVSNNIGIIGIILKLFILKYKFKKIIMLTSLAAKIFGL